MFELIASIILLISAIGIIFILGKKVPVLVRLPQGGHHGFKKPELIVKVHEKIKAHHFHLFQKQMLLHKVLSFVKVLTLKIETKVDQLLHGIRKKAQLLDKEIKKRK